MKDVYDMDLKVVNFKPPKFVRFSTISLLNFGVFLFHKNVLNMINRIIIASKEMTLLSSRSSDCSLGCHRSLHQTQRPS